MIKRYVGKKQLELLVRIKMIVIYTADVEWAENVYDLGGLRLVVEPAYLVKFDTDEVYHRLNEKICRQERLSEEELMELMILPLTVKGNQEKQKLIVDAVNMARKLEDGSQTVRAMAGLLTFTDKIIDKKFKERIKEEMRMTQIAQMFIEEGRQEGRQEGREEAEEKIIKTMLLKNKTIEEIHQDTELPIAMIEKVKASFIK